MTNSAQTKALDFLVLLPFFSYHITFHTNIRDFLASITLWCVRNGDVCISMRLLVDGVFNSVVLVGYFLAEINVIMKQFRFILPLTLRRGVPSESGRNIMLRRVTIFLQENICSLRSKESRLGGSLPLRKPPNPWY
jgi:hypothetical protein